MGGSPAAGTVPAMPTTVPTTETGPSVRPWTAVLLVLGASVLAGLGNTAMAFASSAVLVAAGLRFILGAVVFVPLSAAGPGAGLRGLSGAMWLAALAEAAAIGLLFLSVVQSSVAVASVLACTAPLMTAAVNRMAGRQPISGRAVLLMVGVAGGTVAVAVGGGTAAAFDDLTGVGWGLASAACVATSALLNGWHGQQVSATTRTAALTLCGTVLFVPLAVLEAGGVPTLTWPTVAVAAFIALVPGGLAKVMQLTALKVLPVPVTLALASSSLSVAALAAWLLFAQTLSPAQVAGLGLVLGCVTALALAAPGRSAPRRTHRQ